MNISIDREILLENLNTIARGLPARSPMPILTGIKLYATDTDLYMTSSNSDISVEVVINDSQLVIQQPGQTVVPGKVFIDIIRKINSRKINLYVSDDKVLVIKADRGEYKLQIMDPVDYPKIDFVLHENPLVIDADVLKGVIRETVFATATSEKKPILTGVNLKNQGGKLIATATDSFRLSQKIVAIDPEYKDFNITVPNKSFDELLKWPRYWRWRTGRRSPAGFPFPGRNALGFLEAGVKVHFEAVLRLALPERPYAEVRAVLAAGPEREDARLVVVELDELPAEARDGPGRRARRVVEVHHSLVQRPHAHPAACGRALVFDEGPRTADADGRRDGESVLAAPARIGRRDREERRDEGGLAFALARHLGEERPHHPGVTCAGRVAVLPVGGPRDERPQDVSVVALALIVDAVDGPEAPRAVRPPAEEREQHGVRLHPVPAARHPVAVPERPEGELEVVHHPDVGMLAVYREEPPVEALLRVASVEPERDEGELAPLLLGVVLPVDEVAEAPPVAVLREDWPEDVHVLALRRPERTERVVVLLGLLLVERKHLEGRGEEKAT